MLSADSSLLRLSDVLFTEREFENVRLCLESRSLDGDGPFTQRCHTLLETHYRVPTFLTPSCTAALEMAALLLDIAPGDEVIMPSFTFVSTANAFVLRGATPVFVDIRADTLNLDERLVERAITPRTRAIAPVHYAGVGCEMEALTDIATRHGLAIVEDAAQGYGAHWRGRPLGTFGTFGTLSFHGTKNVTAGEAGALIVNDPSHVERAAILREKGTNRTAFKRKEVCRYEWLDVGSSYLPSDLTAALLLAQLEAAPEVTAMRMRLWDCYHRLFEAAEYNGLLERPKLPWPAGHNAHIYHVRLRDSGARDRILKGLARRGVAAASHYIPLHASPGGRRFGRIGSTMAETERSAAAIIRMPLHPLMDIKDVERAADALLAVIVHGGPC